MNKEEMPSTEKTPLSPPRCHVPPDTSDIETNQTCPMDQPSRKQEDDDEHDTPMESTNQAPLSLLLGMIEEKETGQNCNDDKNEAGHNMERQPDHLNESLHTAAAAELEQTSTLYPRLLNTLEANSIGMKCSQIIQNVRGFGYFLCDYRTKAGILENLSPAGVLRRLKGVQEVQQSNGASLYFRCPNDLKSFEQVEGHATVGLCSSVSLPDANSNVSSLVLDCLQQMQRLYRYQSSWPGNANKLKKFLTQVHTSPGVTATGALSELSGWIIQQHKEGKTLAKMNKLLKAQLGSAGVLSFQKSKYVWQLSRVVQILESVHEKSKGTDSSPLAITRAPEGDSEYHPENQTLRDTGCSKPDVQEETVSLEEYAVILDLLRHLETTHQSRHWPGNTNDLKEFLEQQVRTCSSTATSPFRCWFGVQKKELKTIAQINRVVKKRLVRLGFLSLNKENYIWQMANIRRALEAANRNDSAADNYLTSRESQNESQPAIRNFAASNAGTHLIDSPEHLAALEVLYPFSSRDEGTPDIDGEKMIVAVDCEGVPDHLYLIQVATLDAAYVFDCVKLGDRAVCSFLSVLFCNNKIFKLFHDLHKDAWALFNLGGVSVDGALDTQLVVEALTGELHAGFNKMLEHFHIPSHKGKSSMKDRIRLQGGELFASRPMSRDVLEYAADDVRLLVLAANALPHFLEEKSLHSVQRASDRRARAAALNGGKRRVCFDVSKSYQMSSYELLQATRPNDMFEQVPLDVSNETSTLLSMLSQDLVDDLSGHTDQLSEIVLDKGRNPHAWIGGKRKFLVGPGRIVEQPELDAIVDKLGGFGTDNRAGLERQLHRISAIRNRENSIVGLTMRIGRHVSGNAGIISDLLFADTTKSILFLGEPGSGKTTVVREATRLLAEHTNVCIVDTSNEIAGDGDIPHPCVGFARRMMVPTLDQQSAVMIECVQNHTPEVMVIDEIGRTTEVESARTCKNRGVRMLASAHGDLRGLIKNPKLRGLVGGVSSVTLGDMQAKTESKKNPGGKIQKTKSERAGPPTFDIVVEMRRGVHHEWRIVLDVAAAVDRVLQGGEYQAQLRTRDPLTGDVALHLVRA